ncbi:MAG: hypothetical protein K0Q60_1146, partial [Microvirga sp.]|nr:hypothetical protein [Microvirga sp.]
MKPVQHCVILPTIQYLDSLARDDCAIWQELAIR